MASMSKLSGCGLNVGRGMLWFGCNSQEATILHPNEGLGSITARSYVTGETVGLY